MGELLGWDINQWAHAIARTGVKPTTTREATELRQSWMRKYNHTPLEIKIAGVEYEYDREAAQAVFELPGWY